MPLTLGAEGSVVLSIAEGSVILSIVEGSRSLTAFGMTRNATFRVIKGLYGV
jgi:hypothetical protein